MDRITQSLLDEFISTQSLSAYDESAAFEHFAGYLVTSQHYCDNVSTPDIAVGGGADCGIDCISIIVNGMLVTEPEEISELSETNGYLDVTFILTQAERTSGFESAKIGQFAFGVKDFFSNQPRLPRNDKIKQMAEIADEIFKHSGRFRRGNPRCFLYYATTGQWTDDAHLKARRDAERSDLQALGIFREVEFHCVGADTLQRFYQDTKNATSAEINFPYRTALPDIRDVEQAYIGVLTGTEYLKLLHNDNQEIITSLFYDNVRDWQQWNSVNTEIRSTLESESERRLFPLMNNGVTIVAKRINPTGNRCLIEDYQIVNGCQTSYVIHEGRDLMSDAVLIPVRLIATTNSEVRNAIIKATNRQTQISDDQLFALSDFPKLLENYFPTFEGRKKLYYERRSRQYNQAEGVEKVRVIDMRTLVRSFASVFLDMPHRTTRNYRALMAMIGNEIFKKGHKLLPYYTAAYAAFKLEYLFRNQTIDTSLKPARYHILMAIRHLVVPGRMPRMEANEIDRKSQALLDVLWDDATSVTKFSEAAELVERVAKGNLHRDNIRTESFTKELTSILPTG